MTAEFFLLLCMAAAVAVLSLRFSYSRWQAAHRNKLFQQPLTPEQILIISENVPLYQKLPAKYRDELEGNIQVFLDGKEFVGCAGLEVTETMRLTIAANACMLLLTRGIRFFPGFKSILVYPDTYSAPQKHRQGHVEETRISRRAGESWYRGPVVLSWENVIKGSLDDTDGFNVVLHEFAHKLDEQNALMDGVPILREQSDYSNWSKVLQQEYEMLLGRVKKGQNRVIDSYGATSPVEFFAVITESFFEKPEQMRSRLPDLYKQLTKFYGLDPASW